MEWPAGVKKKVEDCNKIKVIDYRNLICIPKSRLSVLRVERQSLPVREYRHQSFVNKFLFFLMREGLRSLWNKVQWVWFQKKILQKRAFVVVRDRLSGKYYAGLQLSVDQPVFYFLRCTEMDRKPESDELSDIAEQDPFIGAVRIPNRLLNNRQDELPEKFVPITISNGVKRREKKNRELYLVGAGQHANTIILRAFREFDFKVAVDFNYEILTSSYLKSFQICTNDFYEILAHDNTNNVKCGILASYHSYHTQQALDFLQNMTESRVIIEKPPCITREDLRQLTRHYSRSKIFIGYNRRFIPWNLMVRDLLGNYQSPVMMNMLINEVQISDNHWYRAPNQGTRVSANLCHWIDLAIFLLDNKPAKLTVAINGQLGIEHSVFTLHFDDGSIVNLVPTDMGNCTRGVQEQIFIKSEELDIHIDDYLKMRIWEKGKVRRFWKLRRDKGHDRMYKSFSRAIINDTPSTYSKSHLVASTLSYIKFVELFQAGTATSRLDYAAFDLSDN